MAANHSVKTGFSFGLTSGVITTLGLMVGLHSGTHSQAVVIGGVLVIAVADAFSDALGIHVSEEAEGQHTVKEVWQATISTFLTKFIFSLSFLIPVFLFGLERAITISVIWGLSLLSFFSLHMASFQKEKPWKVVFEHLIIACVVIAITHFLGDWVATFK